MARRHGRAIIPFGKSYKGVRVSLLPDAYLSWLTTQAWVPERFPWLWESVLAELRHRGLNDEGAVPDDEPESAAVEPESAAVQATLNLSARASDLAQRRYRL